MIVLSMIVKDEAHVIRRCLESVLPFVDAWVIADTGSSDETREIVREVMGDLPGELIDSEWVDFATNRNIVLDRARLAHPGFGWYALTIDADEVLNEVRALPAGARTDAYTLDVTYADTRYRRVALLRLDRPWEWVGPVHEYAHVDDATIEHLTSPTVTVYHEGARSRDPETYRKDCALLETALARDPENARNRFYLAQSCRDAGDLPSAAREYERRAGMGGFPDEVWFSLFQIARIKEWSGEPAGQVCWALLRAYEANHRRAEVLVELARVERLRGHFAAAALYAEKATTLPIPADGLFVDQSAYTWRAFDELCISAYWAGELEVATYAGGIACRMRPDDERLKENLRMCQP